MHYSHVALGISEVNSFFFFNFSLKKKVYYFLNFSFFQVLAFPIEGFVRESS